MRMNTSKRSGAGTDSAPAGAEFRRAGKLLLQRLHLISDSGALDARCVLVVVACPIIVAALLSMVFHAYLDSTLESAELDASKSIGRIYEASHRTALRDWLSSPGPDSQILVDT